MAAPRKDDVKALILEKTEHLLAHKMLPDISLAEIAKACGISKGTLYYHYKTKDEIVFDLTDRYLTEQWNELVSWSANPNKDTSLHRLVKYVAERNIASPPMRMHLYYDAITGNEEIRQKLLRRYDDFQTLISQKIAERTDEVPAEYLAWLVLMASDGLFLQRLMHNERLDIDQFITQSTGYMRFLTKKNTE